MKKIEKLISLDAVAAIVLIIAGVITFLFPQLVSAEWTPLITSADFTGIHTDVGTTAAGVISILLIVLGIGILVRVLSR